MNEIQNSIPAGQPKDLAEVAISGAPDPMWTRSRQLAIPRLTQGLTMALSYVLGDLADQAKQARDMNHFRLLEGRWVRDTISCVDKRNQKKTNAVRKSGLYLSKSS